MAIKLGSVPWKIWRSHWRHKGSWFGLRLPLALICLAIFQGIGYLTINIFSHWRNWTAFDPETRFDTMIPVVPWMILPYYTLYLYYPLIALLGMKNNRTQREVVIFHQILLLLTGVVLMVFLIFPAEIDLREPLLETELGIWQTWFDLLHGIDNPWNAWPSLHIVQSMLIVMLVFRWYWNENPLRRIFLLGFLLSWVLLAISITTTKQHYIWDAVSGVIVTYLAWFYWIKPSLVECHNQPVLNKFNDL